METCVSSNLEKSHKEEIPSIVPNAEDVNVEDGKDSSNSNLNSPKTSKVEDVKYEADPSPSHIQNLEEKLNNSEKQIEQLKAILMQKDSIIALYDREKSILEKEKNTLKRQADIAIREKESIVISFANKEKIVIDARKETDHVEKLLSDSKREIKNITIKYQTLNEEKSRIQYMLEEKCLEIKKHQKEIEKLKSDVTNLETKIKWNSVKLNQEIEGRLAAEKKFEEEKVTPKVEEKEIEQKRMESEASLILLKHEVESKEKQLESIKKENKILKDKTNGLQESLSKEILEKSLLSSELETLKDEHTSVQNSLTKEMLNSAKLRGQLEELSVLQTRSTINEEKMLNLNETITELEEKLKDCSEEIKHLREKEKEFLGVNKEMSEKIADLQKQILLKNSKVLAAETEYEIIRKEKEHFDEKYGEIESKLSKEFEQRNEERLLLTKHLSEKTKLYEGIKIKLDNTLGDLEAVKKKHSQIFKELNREIHKYKKLFEESSWKVENDISGSRDSQSSKEDLLNAVQVHQPSSSNQCHNSDSESDAQSNSSINQVSMEPSKEHLVNRILRLQKASARQTEKIDFLENHTMSLVSELQKKSKLIQYYMMRDQAGALTSSKSDQNKSELAKYGGVMSAIYSGIKGSSQTCMTLDLSLEINKKLQAVLEDTLLKNITLKENLDVLGLEVDKLTRELAHRQRK